LNELLPKYPPIQLEYEANTILFSREDNRPPVETTVWFYEANTEFDATHPAVFCFGTRKKMLM